MARADLLIWIARSILLTPVTLVLYKVNSKFTFIVESSACLIELLKMVLLFHRLCWLIDLSNIVLLDCLPSSFLPFGHKGECDPKGLQDRGLENVFFCLLSTRLFALPPKDFNPQQKEGRGDFARRHLFVIPSHNFVANFLWILHFLQACSRQFYVMISLFLR